MKPHDDRTPDQPTHALDEPVPRYALDDDAWLELPDGSRESEADLVVTDVNGRQWRLRHRTSWLERLRDRLLG